MPTAETHLPPGDAPEDRPRPSAARVVTDFLAAMEARDLDSAQQALGERFQMTFPGTAPMTSLGELIDWARNRYRFVRKTNDAVEAIQADNVTVVYIRGTLNGEWPDGSPFDGVRFIDRFELSDGKIIRQDVWNDIAEVRAT